ncbi:HAMP domain-containing sensor histidine kinase [Mycolicibacterium diernhoferi]|uniref:histidine kinase n=1 Tax=Mycolicibacterium diernhoferi TaxID=1801 RepID=A0A1Q4HJF4_9MYCO|nr:HAMP domain-containing sensor histidine kinase [Mycolicibacterium diernhoferi]OJZ67679.1 two-component sensor histidine kinase [Mycolicibacterium diernhoferi]OPE54194.1 two-component sensor histidine kinase [Mycolicibacterium diernhoferi]PEG53908.1 sensor histidine kinase [Mycolicibacterium diernhoferi]QYL20319.1 HAMP domain-containing histidine kinase [Mycolicibacterium diernhoferi]
MRRGLARPGNWGISARSAFVAASVVFVALGVTGMVLAGVLYRSMLSEVDNAAAARVARAAAIIAARGPDGLDDTLLSTDSRILAVQVIGADGTVLRRSPGAPASPLIPVGALGTGPRIGMPEHDSPFGQIRFSAQTISGPDDAQYTVVVGEGSPLVLSTVGTVVTALAVAAPVVIAVSAAATYLLVRRSMRSVDDIRSRVAAITTSDLTERVPVPDSRDEIAALAVTMNEMLARVEAGHTAQQRFVGDASHELRSPLATIISALEVAQAHPDLLNADLAEHTLMPEAQRMRSLIDDLLLLARADEQGWNIRHDDVDLDDLAAGEIERIRREHALEVTATITPARVTGDPAALARVLRNLLDNAARHATSVIEVDLRRAGADVVLMIGDDGPGIPAPDRLRVFDRFVRLDEGRSRGAGGTGLGLAIVSEIVAAHLGQVRIEDRPGGGTRAVVQLTAVGLATDQWSAANR